MKTILDLVNDSFVKFPNNEAVSVLGRRTYTYEEVSKKVEEYAILLKNIGIVKGDKIAILGPSSPEWVIAYLAIVSLGAIAVPLLPDYCKEEIINILEHSETKTIYVSKSKRLLVNENQVENMIELENNQLLNREIVLKEEPYSFLNSAVSPDDLASIIYTSGTTGKSKGVELTHKNIYFMVTSCDDIIVIKPDDRVLSILPIAHIYEFTLGFMIPFSKGSHITYLEKAASPSVLMDALKNVKPTIMLSVPLVIEKVYYKKVAPLYKEGGPLERFKDIPLVRKSLNKVIGFSLKKAFGGKLRFFGIGGAKLNPEVEEFLKEADFPYAIGYGLTETSPLVAGSGPKNTILQSTGPKLKGTDLKIINPNAEGVGEIVTKGDHVMRGYHKEPELTNMVMTEDGYFKTGDLGYLDQNQYVYIKGRIKNMILGPNGENIYPENISFIMNQHPFVEESLVVADEKNGLIGIIKLDYENVNKYIAEHSTSIVEIYNHIKDYVNSRVNKSSQIKDIKEVTEFEKTSTQKIRAYKYQGK